MRKRKGGPGKSGGRELKKKTRRKRDSPSREKKKKKKKLAKRGRGRSYKGRETSIRRKFSKKKEAVGDILTMSILRNVLSGTSSNQLKENERS